MNRTAFHKIRRFRNENSGAAMVEFAIALPLLLLVLAIVVEGSRITWIHQVAASGVRDASRYLARTEQSSVCNSTAGVQAFNNNTAIAARAQEIVTSSVDLTNTILPTGVRNVVVNHTLQCTSVDFTGTGTTLVPVIQVAVTLTIDFPFGGVFDLFGDPLAPLTTVVADESRVYGI